MNIRKLLSIPICAIGFACGGIVSVFADTACAGLPSAYTQVEYLTSSGIQYINTDTYFNASQDFRIVGDVINPSTSYRKVIAGNWNGDTSVQYTIEFGGSSNSKPGYFRNYLSNSSYITDKFANSASPANTVISYDSNYTASNHTISNSITANGSTQTYSFSTVSLSGSATRPFRLFLDYRSSSSSIAYPLSIGRTKMYKAGSLVADYVPAQRRSDNVLGMYDLVSGSFLTNSGSGSFTAGSMVCNNAYDIVYDLGTESCLPSGYTRVEYLTSTGSQYITTSVYFDITKNLRIKGDVINPNASYRKVIIGNFYVDNYASFGIEFGGDSNDKPGYFRNWIASESIAIHPESFTSYFAASAQPVNTLISYDTSYNASNRTILTSLTYNGSTTSYSFNTITTSGTTIRPFRFFLDYRDDIYVMAYPLSIGRTKIYKADELVGDFAPARRNSDNVLGMYDLVSGGFLTNSGSGSFTAGSNVGNTNCASNYTNAPVSYVYGTGATINGTPTRAGYTFAGWCTDSALTNCAMTQTISASATGNKTFYAKWTNSSANTITLTFDGVSTTPSQCTYGSTFVPPTPPARPGYVFAGWKIKHKTHPTCGIPDLSISTTGMAYGYYSFDTRESYSNNVERYGLNVRGQWATEFGFGTVYGMANCNTTAGSYLSVATITPESSGRYCWCQFTGFTPTNDSYTSGPQCTITPAASSWVYNAELSWESECAIRCPQYCGDGVRAAMGFCNKMFTVAGN